MPRGPAGREHTEAQHCNVFGKTGFHVTSVTTVTRFAVYRVPRSGLTLLLTTWWVDLDQIGHLPLWVITLWIRGMQVL